MRVWSWMLLIGVGCGPSQAEVDNLERRVNALERRLRAVEGGEPPKGRRGGRKRGAAAPAPPPSGPVQVDVLGDAKQVLLGTRDKTLPVPGQVPAGPYAVLAVFADGEEAAKAGSLEISGPGPVVITCAAATRRCIAKH